MKIALTGKHGELRDILDMEITKVLRSLGLVWNNLGLLGINDEEVITYAEIRKPIEDSK